MPQTTTRRPILGVPQRPLRRTGEAAVLGGVCAGLAVRLGVRERTVRIAFAVAALLDGVGLALYAALWVLTPREGEATSVGQRLARGHGELNIIIAATTAVVALILLTRSAALGGVAGVVWSLVLTGAGALAVWRGASPEERVHLQALLNAAPVVGSSAPRGWRGLALRVVPGLALMVVGLSILSRLGGVWGAAVPAILGALILLGGLLILLAPWWLQNLRDLSLERRRRVRVEERAVLAAHIHDSVLQTLTLIERHAGDETEIVRLARAQERELRRWLFEPEGARDPGAATLVGAIETLQREVEADYRVKVEVVTVGDAPLDDDLAALVAAAREATVNAAKWSGVALVALYCEVELERVSLYVRDTGRGFDPASVPADRHGIARSIVDRLARRGGTAVVRSTPGEGTEVALELMRARATS